MHSYYWRGCELSDPRLARAHEELASADLAKNRVDALLLLLRSTDPVAVGIALDHYRSAQSTSRMGTENPFADYSEEILQVARRALNQPPSAAEMSPFTGEGANHASALFAMTSLTDPEDAGLLVRILQSSTNPEVRNVALAVARETVWQSETPDQALISILGDIALNTGERYDERVRAIGALGSARTEKAISTLRAGTEDEDLRIQAHSAHELAEEDLLEQYRPFLEHLVSTWPEDAPFPASEVRYALDE
ncbi:HEAT repeat domain-containing protein [Streptomyces lunaelactis]|uniref:HEAT repeat domain-containing protein n=1 Tax=Streptomyces lunaelactis TaxID=1535768 RepID=UPI001585280C|nr:HEAT repeat domain-containing protein [Streptomyces lunaelactis]NUK56442.1 HEAT repeat domain-containing protein [Streptomyces lunaelactis]NUK91031.1 HEAT repeat domain-containing protein [Streptomyces lunaelactis]NUL33299.1 HEAT repeat domain-containing protein [Streptomyces lunaelactis]